MPLLKESPFHPSWDNFLLPELEKEYMKSLMSFLNLEIEQGKSILPIKELWFNALNSTPIDKVKVVILGQDPYPTPGHAHGLCFSVQADVRPIPKSLKNIYKELKRRNIFKVALAYIIVAWLLVEVICDFAIAVGMPAWTPIFFIFILFAGFPMALLLSWAYEITPEGMKRSDSIDEPKSITKKTGSKIENIIIAALLLTIIYYLMKINGYIIVG